MRCRLFVCAYIAIKGFDRFINAVLTDKLHFMFNKTYSCRTHVIKLNEWTDNEPCYLFPSFFLAIKMIFLSHNFNQ